MGEGGSGSPPAPPGPPPATTAAPPSTGCGSPQWQGDNFCDDENNNAECAFDGGDCCGDDVNETYCDACECLEDQGCEFENWVGDNFCDDGNNNAGCDFDGGDCCGEDVNTQYCSECACLEPATTTTSEAPGTGGCEFENWVGDNFCDDGDNNAGCDFDGGDCCGDDVNT